MSKGKTNFFLKSILIKKGEGGGGGERAEEEGPGERSEGTGREESETDPWAGRTPDSPGERWQDLNLSSRNG